MKRLNRRGFLSRLGIGVGAAVALDLELEAWKPGAKVYSIPVKPVILPPPGIVQMSYDFHLSPEDMAGSEERLIDRFVRPGVKDLLARAHGLGSVSAPESVPLELKPHIGYGKILEVDGVKDLRVTTRYDVQHGGNIGSVELALKIRKPRNG